MRRHCQMIQDGEIQAVVGDASRNGVGGAQYCGVWSLTSRRRPFNAFGNSYAGLIPGEIRGRAPVLECAGARTCILRRDADDAYPSDIHAVYEVKAPYVLDHALTLRDRKDQRRPPCAFREVSWCSYINCPDEPELHFLSEGAWRRYMSPAHGVACNLAPSYLPPGEIETFPPRNEKREPFHWGRTDIRFDRPFYYGRLGDMALIHVFDTPRWLRFYFSPSGGGAGLLPGRTCPAWDFEWIIPEREYAVGRDYTFRMRLIYKPFVSEADILDEVRRTQEELGFEREPA